MWDTVRNLFLRTDPSKINTFTGKETNYTLFPSSYLVPRGSSCFSDNIPLHKAEYGSGNLTHISSSTLLFATTVFTKLYVILTVHSIAIGSYLFIIPTHAQFYNIITSPLYVFRHSECHPQGVTVLKA